MKENTNPNFWDCECEDNYIHPKTVKECKRCGAIQEEQPDSIQSEVEQYILNTRGFTCIGLHNTKTLDNIGSVLRAAGCYNVSMVAITNHKYEHSKYDTRKQYRHMPLLKVNNLKDVIPHMCVPVAVDIIKGATSLPKYIHPKSAFYIFGPENGTLDESITSWCRDIIYIPTNRCMNLAATVNVVLYDRMMKEITNKGDRE